MVSIGVPMEMIRSFKRREKMSQPRSPRGVDSTTLGIIPLGSRISARPFIHFGSFGLKTAPMLTPYLSKTTYGLSFSPLYIGRDIPSVKKRNVQRMPARSGTCNVIIAPARYKRKNRLRRVSISPLVRHRDAISPVPLQELHICSI